MKVLLVICFLIAGSVATFDRQSMVLIRHLFDDTPIREERISLFTGILLGNNWGTEMHKTIEKTLHPPKKRQDVIFTWFG
ncbi:unnamed protein product [Nezara viridula]|uniref:Neuropeptide n=1 Tax=Nezara viridula TaxID=85310 RepID=A0A9P0E8L8_NEZVI|nr:unnamed protein product [Nezara viridula]